MMYLAYTDSNAMLCIFYLVKRARCNRPLKVHLEVPGKKMYKMPESKSRSRILLVGNNPELRERQRSRAMICDLHRFGARIVR